MDFEILIIIISGITTSLGVYNLSSLYKRLKHNKEITTQWSDKYKDIFDELISNKEEIIMSQIGLRKSMNNFCSMFTDDIQKLMHINVKVRLSFIDINSKHDLIVKTFASNNLEKDNISYFSVNDNTGYNLIVNKGYSYFAVSDLNGYLKKGYVYTNNKKNGMDGFRGLIVYPIKSKNLKYSINNSNLIGFISIFSKRPISNEYLRNEELLKMIEEMSEKLVGYFEIITKENFANKNYSDVSLIGID